MASVSQCRLDPSVAVGPSPPWAHRTRISEAGIDFALLVCALFLQRFGLTFGHSLMSLDIVPAAFILMHQFVTGRLVIQYDRLLWFLAAGAAVTCSLLLNFNSTMLPSYSEFILVYFLFTLVRPSNADRYRSTLHAFQFLVALLSFLAVAQFIAQFVLDGRELIRFYGIFPEFLFTDRVNTIIPVAGGSALIKSNGIFLTEPSTLSQLAALAILIELLEFRRPRYLLLLALGLLLSYSGTGLMLFLGFVPLAGIHRSNARLPVLLVIVFIFGLVASGTIDISAFLSRADEFDDPRASGFQRFVSPFWLAKEHFHMASLPVLLMGSGPGTTDAFADRFWYTGFAGTWIKLFYEYGIIGSFVFLCFLASCFRRSPCPMLVLAAILFSYVFLGGMLLSTPFLIMMVVLCTLSTLEPRRNRIDKSSRFQASLIPRSAAGSL